MPSISNIRTDAAPAIEATPAVAPIVSAAPPRANRVTIIDERHASVVDSRGRTIKVKRLSALDRIRLFKAMGAVHAENRMAAAYASAAAACTDIDGLPVPYPTSDIQLDAIVGRLDEEGLEAVVNGLAALSPPSEDVAAEARGF
jgi:hypothetical protein